jgi:hypothetical protein
MCFQNKNLNISSLTTFNTKAHKEVGGISDPPTQGNIFQNKRLDVVD